MELPRVPELRGHQDEQQAQVQPEDLLVGGSSELLWPGADPSRHPLIYLQSLFGGAQIYFGRCDSCHGSSHHWMTHQSVQLGDVFTQSRQADVV